MRANSPSAFLTSLTLHGAVAGLIVFLTYYSVWQQGPPPVIFELVAGPPTAPDELVAPALGNSLAPVKVDVPKVERPPEKPQPKIEEVVPTVKTVETPPPPSDVVPPPKQTKPKPDTSLLKEMKKNERVYFKDYLKKHPTPKPQPPQVAAANPRTGKAPKIDYEGIAQGVRGGSTANKRGGGGGKAMTREEQSEFNTYISLLRNAILEAYVSPPGVNDKLVAVVTFDITSNGQILNPHITRSSGSRDYDESVLDALRRMRSIGPTPSGKSETDWTVPIRMHEE